MGAQTLQDIADCAKWSTNVVLDNTCQQNYPEIAKDRSKQVKDPDSKKLIKTVMFSGGVAQKLSLASRADEWLQEHRQRLPIGTDLTFKLGDSDAPYTGAAAYVLDR